MKKSALELYAVVVCFAMVCAMLISAGIVCSSLLSIYRPDITMVDYRYSNFESDNAYWRSIRDDKQQRPAPQELTQQRAADLQSALRSESRDGVRALINATIFLLLAAAVFMVHWRMGLRPRQAPDRTNRQAEIPEPSGRGDARGAGEPGA